MEIRDVIHGAIQVRTSELPVVDSRYFQRLRNIRQVGFAEFSFPTATHSRYTHSLGAMETATRAFESIFPKPHSETHDRFLQVLRLAALLHDIGHGPLSHTTEIAMPPLNRLHIPKIGENGRSITRQATHEDYTLKIILDSELTPLLETMGRPMGFKPIHIAALIHPPVLRPEDETFFSAKVNGENVNFHPILHQLVSSELDADRMDYLRRDNFYAGVSYGGFDFNWILANLTAHIHERSAYLTLGHRALYAFEDFLISRYHMFLMVYFHYKSVVFDKMLEQYFESSDCTYQIPSDIEAYASCDDAQLWSHLSKSTNPWAKRISNKRPYRMLIELHSGIPTSESAHDEQEKIASDLEKRLRQAGIHYLRSTSSSEISKHFRKQGQPIFVRYDNGYNPPTYIPLNECTSLFARYPEKRSISRIYVSPENLSKCRDLGRSRPISFGTTSQREIDSAESVWR